MISCHLPSAGQNYAPPQRSKNSCFKSFGLVGAIIASSRYGYLRSSKGSGFLWPPPPFALPLPLCLSTPCLAMSAALSRPHVLSTYGWKQLDHLSPSEDLLFKGSPEKKPYPYQLFGVPRAISRSDPKDQVLAHLRNCHRHAGWPWGCTPSPGARVPALV